MVLLYLNELVNKYFDFYMTDITKALRDPLF